MIALPLQNPGTKSTCHMFDKITHTQLNKTSVQADLCSDRVKRALAVAKSRGKKLGTHNRKVAGKGAAARKKQLEAQAIKLLPKVVKLVPPYGGRIVQRNLNKDAAALRMNHGKIYHLSKVQRIVKVLQKKRLLR